MLRPPGSFARGRTRRLACRSAYRRRRSGSRGSGTRRTRSCSRLGSRSGCRARVRLGVFRSGRVRASAHPSGVCGAHHRHAVTRGRCRARGCATCDCGEPGWDGPPRPGPGPEGPRRSHRKTRGKRARDPVAFTIAQPVPEDGRELDPRRGPKPEATDDAGAGARVAGSVTLNQRRPILGRDHSPAAESTHHVRPRPTPPCRRVAGAPSGACTRRTRRP